ncbi:MAG: flagellar biosynthetic protein FliR [Phycisphaerales bacterium]|jgi:flagellar biosynthetic protein FliR|nr:flagellar biosynthetic protein FliR [Phycisphaerales bacterium]
MPSLEPILPHLVPFVLVAFRLGGMFLLAPMLTSAMIPPRFKVLLVIAMAGSLYPTLPFSPAPEVDLFSLLPMVVCELAIGFVMGLIAAVPLAAMEMAGVVAGQQVGFGLARVYNPELEADTDILGQLLFYLAIGAFVALNGMETLFVSLADTFHRVPPGGMLAITPPLDLLLGVIMSGFELAMRVAAPVTGITLLLVVALGVVGKTMPQLNIMAVGFTLKIVGAISILAAATHVISAVAGDEVRDVLSRITQWAPSVAPAIR